METLSLLARSRWTLAVWAIGLLLLSFGLNTRHNGFPYFYHPDEPGKVEQVITEKWNFNHPMLLLSATKGVLELGEWGEDPQTVVEVGRKVSAAFTAVGVVALALLAFLWRGWPASLAAGGALAFHHQLYELSHYMKEDSALLMGMALAFLAAYAYWQRPGWATALGVGAASALAISGKYVGVIGLIFGGVVIAYAPADRRIRNVSLCAVAFLVTLALVNAPLLSDLKGFQKSFDKEVGLVVHGQRGMTRRVPHAQYWNVFIDNSTPVMWVLLAVFLAGVWRKRRKLNLIEWMLVAFPFIYALALSFSPKSNDRYFLPATAAFTVLSAVGIIELARRLSQRVPEHTVIAVGGIVLLLGQLPSWMRYERAFQHDDTQELIEFLRLKVPATAVIAKDNRVMLPDPRRKRDAARLNVIPQKILAERFAADLGTLDELRAKGVTHVAVSESDYGRFFLSGLKPQKGQEEEFLRRKAFYEQLFRGGKDLVFERERGTVIYLHPGIRVYRIANPPPETPVTASPEPLSGSI